MSFKDIWADKLSALFGRKEEIIPMYLIVGLGNPGKQYDMTRHNIGFHTIDYIADKYGAKLTKLKFKAVYGEATISGEKVYLVKPQTYMNLSGDSPWRSAPNACAASASTVMRPIASCSGLEGLKHAFRAFTIPYILS